MLDECLTVGPVVIGSRERSFSYCIWLYFRSGVSFREVEEMMAAGRAGYGVRNRIVMPGVADRQHRYLNNRPVERRRV